MPNENEVTGKVTNNNWIWWVIITFIFLSFILLFVIPKENQRTANFLDGTIDVEETRVCAPNESLSTGCICKAIERNGVCVDVK